MIVHLQLLILQSNDFDFFVNNYNQAQWVRVFFIETGFVSSTNGSRMVTGLTLMKEGKIVNQTFNIFPKVLIKCRIFGDKELGLRLFSSYTYSVVYVSRRPMELLIRDCDEYLRTKYNEIAFEKASILDGIVIFPGTKWCGAGNIAASYEDLGVNRETDKCCRVHDHCPTYIRSGETKYNLTNRSLFARYK